MRILLADDDALALRLLHRYLEGWGHEVVEVRDGASAWALFEKEPFAMVITDWMMPEVDGLELIRRIRAHALGNRVYAVLVTGRASKEDVVQGMDAGADDFLAKPFDKDELRVRIREGERIVALEQALIQAETRCAELNALIAQASAEAERELAEATALLGGLTGEAALHDALAHLAAVRQKVAALRGGATAEAKPPV